jgi:predicted DNA-binding transcriptional regulator AlpA
MITALAAQPNVETMVRNLSVPEAARYLGLSEAFLNRMRSTGGGPIFFKLGARVVYSTTDLESWLAARRRRSTSDTGEVA